MGVAAGAPRAVTSSEAQAGEAPTVALAPSDPAATCGLVDQSPMVHVFDTRPMAGGPYYVNDHTLVQADDGSWHLFGIFHEEPMGKVPETRFIHAFTAERDPARWADGELKPVPEPYTIALEADRALGETHLWAPHVVRAEGRYVMVYQGGGPDDYRASIRLAESDDLYRWSRVPGAPLFEDFCAARDPMVTFKDGVYALYYTRCDAIGTKASGVAYRLSNDLRTWTEPRMALALPGSKPTSNSAFTESPFVFERGGHVYMSVTAYPLSFDATLLYRSTAPYAFPDEPVARLRAHAAEWLFDGAGRPLMTHAGPGQRGVWVTRVAL